MVLNLPFISGLFFLKLFHEFIDFSFLLIEDFILLSIITVRTTRTSLLFSKILIDFLDVSLISLDHPSDIANVFF